jgi:predicted permease
MIQDLRYACRSIVRMPILASVIVVSLALGIGVNTVVFSWIQARVIQPIPGARPSGGVLLVEPNPDGGHYPGASWLEFQDMRENLGSFDGLFASRTVPAYVGDAGAVERRFGQLVSANYFTVLGVEPAIGRFFRPDEVSVPGGADAAVISHRLWRTHFQSDPAVTTRTVRVNGRDIPVIGVAPDAFQGTMSGLQFDVWFPATLAPVLANGSRELDERSIRGYNVMGRLRPSVTRRQAQGELAAFMTRLEGQYPETNAGMKGEVLPFYASPHGPQRMFNAALGILQGLMLLVLLAVCGNVANLLLARGSARQAEIGIRLSLGAGRQRIASLVMMEAVVLGLAGASLGALLAVWGTKALLVLPMTGLPLRLQTSIDEMGLTFALLLGFASALVFGAAPALQLSRADPFIALRRGLDAARRNRLRRSLMGAQVALAILVLLVAAMFFRSFMETRSTDPGFRRDGVMLAAYDFSGRDASAEFSRNLAARALDAARALPGVTAAAIAASVPLDIHGLPSRAFTVDGHARTDGGVDEALTNTVTPGYFEVMGIAFIDGADFAPLTDTSAPPQAIVNDAFVRRFVSGGNALGRSLRTRGVTYVISGVVKTSLYNAFGEPPTPIIYLSYRELPRARGEVHLLVGNGDPSAAAGGLLRVMRQVEPELPVFNVRSLETHVDTNLVLRKIPAQMFSVLGPLLLALAAIGIYAVVSYTVSLRTREIGVRMALGATASRVVWTFVREHMKVAAAGAAAGWIVAYAFAMHLPSRSLDGGVFVVVPALLLTIATVACWVPARRAARVDPASALRRE